MGEDALKKHQRERFRQIILPVVLPLLLLILGLVGLFVLAVLDKISGQQVGVIAWILGVIFVLLPMVLLMAIVNGVMLFLAFGSGHLRGLTVKPLELARQYSEKGAELARTTSERIATPVIMARTQAARWRYTINELIGLPEHREKFWDERK